MKAEELTYSPNEEMYLLDEVLREKALNDGQVNLSNQPRIWFTARGSTVGIKQPLDLHYWWCPAIARRDYIPAETAEQKESLYQFGLAINSLMAEGKTRNGIMIKQMLRGLIFNLYS